MCLYICSKYHQFFSYKPKKMITKRKSIWILPHRKLNGIPNISKFNWNQCHVLLMWLIENMNNVSTSHGSPSLGHSLTCTLPTRLCFDSLKFSVLFQSIIFINTNLSHKLLSYVRCCVLFSLVRISFCLTYGVITFLSV